MEISQIYKYLNFGSLFVLLIMVPIVLIQVVNMNYSLTKAVKIIASLGVIVLCTSVLREYHTDSRMSIILALSTLGICVLLNPFRKKKYKIVYSYTNGDVSGEAVFYYMAEEEPDLENTQEVNHLRFEISRDVLEPLLDPRSITILQIGKQKKSLNLSKS